MPRSFSSLDAQDRCLRMRLAQSGPKPSDTFKCAIYGVQSKMPRSFPIQEAHGLYLRLRLVKTGLKPSDTRFCDLSLVNDSLWPVASLYTKF